MSVSLADDRLVIEVVDALAAQLPADQVFERTHAIQVGSSDTPVVHTPGGRVTAGHVIVATHFPFPDRSLAFARVHPQIMWAKLEALVQGAALASKGSMPRASPACWRRGC